MQTEERDKINGPLFQMTGPKKRAVWYFATNQLNLMYMLAAGMIMPPAGFGEKYYEDTLRMQPGWIPLFAGPIPKDVLDRVVRESADLMPVVVGVNLSSLTGSAKALQWRDAAQDIQVPEELTENQAAVCIAAPLPTSLIEGICFASSEDKKAFETDAGDYANVPLSGFKRSVQKRLFKGTTRLDWHGLALPESPNAIMDRFQAAGGMMAMLFRCGNMGDLACRASKIAFDGLSDNADHVLEGGVVQDLDRWMQDGNVPVSGRMSNDLFWGLVHEIICPSSAGRPHLTPKDAVLHFLKSAEAKMDGNSRLALSDLSGDLIGLERLGDKNTTELLRAHPRAVRRALILFFLRSRCAELIEFFHPLLTEPDYIAAAILFAVREKWIGLPLHLRDDPGMDRAVAHRMAAMAHRDFKTGLHLGPPPPACLPLRELLKPGPKGWSKKQSDAGLCLTREMKWPCVSTFIRLGKGEYNLTVDAGGITIDVPGEIKAVDTEINVEAFFTLMTEKRFLDKKLEIKARRMV